MLIVNETTPTMQTKSSVWVSIYVNRTKGSVGMSLYDNELTSAPALLHTLLSVNTLLHFLQHVHLEYKCICCIHIIIASDVVIAVLYILEHPTGCFFILMGQGTVFGGYLLT